MRAPIPILLSALEQVAPERPAGYLEEVLSVSKVKEGLVFIPHEHYARLAAKYNPQASQAIGTGPGSQLKRMLSKIGIQPSPGCQCNKRAVLMDSNGPDWCEEHLEEIVGWLREEAQRAHLPFVDLAGRVLIRRAIKLARADIAQPPLQRR